MAPFALLVLVLFAFALDPARQTLERATPGLYWVTVLFSALLAIARSAALDESRRRPRRPAPVRPRARRECSPARPWPWPPSCWPSRRAGLGVVILYGAEPAGVGLLAGHLPRGHRGHGRHRYAVRRPGQRPAGPRDAAPPAAAPRAGAGPHRRHPAFEAALGGAPADGWPWCGLLAGFAVFYSVAGAAAYGTLLEGS